MPIAKTLVLDLDETLVHSKFEQKLDWKYDWSIPYISRKGEQCTAYVKKRPHVEQFLFEIGQMKKEGGFEEIVLFTAGIRSYADKIVDLLDPEGTIFDRRLFRADCQFCTKDFCFKKDLTKLNKDLTKCCLIDNSPMVFFRGQLRNGIPCTSFMGKGADRELIDLILPVLRNVVESVTVYDPIVDYKQVFLQMLQMSNRLSSRSPPRVNQLALNKSPGLTPA